MQLINEICQHDKFFREVAFKITKNKFDSDDLVQELYLRLINYDQVKLGQMVEKGIAKFVCVRILRQIKIDKFRTNPLKVYDYKFKDEQETYTELNININNLLEDLYWFDKDLFKVYVKDDHSLRSLSEATGISVHKIHKTINKVKREIKEQCKKKKIPLRVEV